MVIKIESKEKMVILIKLSSGELVEGECTYKKPPETLVFTRSNGDKLFIYLMGKADGMAYYYQETSSMPEHSTQG